MIKAYCLPGHNLFRGPRPKSFQELKDSRIDICITLQSGVFEEFHDDTFEAELSQDFGITQVCIPMSDITAPKEHEARKFLRTIDYFKGKNIYVHCKKGKDRTGFMCALFEVNRSGLGGNEAIKRMIALGFNTKIYSWTWIPRLKEFMKRADL